LHPGYSLPHNLVRLGLRDAGMHRAHISGGVSRLALVGVLEGGGHPVVEVLDCLVVLLPEVLEADAEGLGRILWGVGLQELLLQLIPDVLVEPDYVVQRAVPGQGVVPEGKDKLVTSPLVVRPLCNRGSPLQSFNILLGLNGILPFPPVEKGDVCGPPDPVVSNKGLLNCCCHREWSVVRCCEEWREVAAPTAQTKLLLKSFVTFI
jgi:hypothetical protein